VVTLTRLTGSVFALNSDLIERVESTPDTVITLIDGTKYLVRESLEEVVDRVRRYRGSVIAAASHLDLPAQATPEPPADEPPLSATHSQGDTNVVAFPSREA
jgi:flagellar protein FlbD